MATWDIARYVGDQVLDVRNGTDTARRVSQTAPLLEGGRHRYEPSNWTNLRALGQLLHARGVSHGDVFVDFGCGKGQVLLRAAQHGFARVIGVEIAPELAAIARANVAATRDRLACRRVEIVVADAADYDIPADLTHAYFYNPFPADVMASVVRRIGESIAQHPREVRLITLRGEAEGVYADGALARLFGAHGFHLVSRRRQLALYSNGGTPS